MVTNAGGGIPQSVIDWKKTAQKHGAIGSINELGSQVKVRSASKFDFKHFLGLRVIYKFEERKRGIPSAIPRNIIKQFPTPSSLALDKMAGWGEFLGEIRNFPSKLSTVGTSYVPASLGPLVNVWQYQKHVILGDENFADMSKVSNVSPVASRTKALEKLRALTMASPTPAQKGKTVQEEAEELPYSYEDEVEDNAEEQALSEEDLDYDSAEDSEPGTPDYDPNDLDFNTPGISSKGQLIKDEQTVNVFLLAFLSAITATTVPFHTRWLAERNAMVYKKKVRYVARTDGHLRGRAGNSHTLIEVKPRVRIHGDVSIRIQESAQMAAWLTQNKEDSHDPYDNCRIFLLSQDKDEIFVTFPRWGKDYGRDNKSKKKETNKVDIDKLQEDDFL